LPWYLRTNSEVGFWQPGHAPPGKADFYITSTDVADQYGEILKDFRRSFSSPGPVC